MFFQIKDEGASHGDDIGYLFCPHFPAGGAFPGLEKPGIDSKEYESIKLMVSMVTAFMIDGKPDNDEWKPSTTSSPLMCWNMLNDSLEFVPLPEQERLKVWDEILDDAQRSRKSMLNNKL